MNNRIEDLCIYRSGVCAQASPARKTVETLLLTAAFLRDYEGRDIEHLEQAVRAIASKKKHSFVQYCDEMLADLDALDTGPTPLMDDVPDFLRAIEMQRAVQFLNDMAVDWSEQEELLLRAAEDIESWWGRLNPNAGDCPTHEDTSTSLPGI